MILGVVVSSLETMAAQNAQPATLGNRADGLSLNFHNAPLNLVLEYLSDAAGFVINTQAEVRGSLDVSSKTPVTAQEAVELVNSALRKNGYALVRNGRILTLTSLADAKRQDLEVATGNNPDAVEKSEEVIMQIIPIRYIGAAQLMNNLQPLLPARASLSVNESANALILVAAKADIKRSLRIIAALDTSMATASLLKVFRLRYADAKELAAVVQQLFSTQTSGQGSGGVNSRSQGFSPGGGFGPPGFGPGPGGAGVTEGEGEGGARGKVVATADEPSNSLIVSAPAASIAAIANLVAQIDRPVNDITELRIFRLAHADPSQLADQLTQLFPDPTANSADQNQMGFHFEGPPGAEMEGDSTGASDRANKKSRVLAVAEPRTSSLMVSAPGAYMPQIARLIERADAGPARKEKVKVYELQNADPQNVSQILQDLFNRNTTMRNSNNRNSLSGQGNPLIMRQTQQQNSTSRAGQGFGNSGAVGTGGAGGGPGEGGGGGGF